MKLNFFPGFATINEYPTYMSLAMYSFKIFVGLFVLFFCSVELVSFADEEVGVSSHVLCHKICLGAPLREKGTFKVSVLS